MDPVCQEKFNFLQKYVPFLANLIKLLANDSEKEGKLAQMQLLYNLLSKPDNSVKIETLEKCEEVLSRVFGNADEKCDGTDIAESTIQILPFEYNIKVECEDAVENSQLEVDEAAISEQTNGHANADENNTPLPDFVESNNIVDNVPQAASTEQTAVIDSEDVSTEDQQSNELSEKKHELAMEVEEINKDAQDSPATNHNPEMIEKDISAEETKDPSQSATIDKKTVEVNICVENEQSIKEDESLVTTEAEHEDHHTIAEEIQENNADIILPDDGEVHAELTEQAMSPTSDGLLCLDGIEAERQTDTFVQNPTEALPFKIISAESLATSSDRNLLNHIDSENDSESEDVGETAKEQDKTYDPLDPLNPTSNSVKSEIPEISKADKLISLVQQDNSTNNDDDDDDVLLIETRSSPICIDSDPEDEGSESTKKSPLLTHIPTKIIAEPPPKLTQKSKPCARKSTAMVKDAVRHASSNSQTRKTANLQRKSKEITEGPYIVKKDPKLLMETINLIDSDSDEEQEKIKNAEEQTDDDVIIVGSSSQQRVGVSTKKTGSVVSSKQGKRLPPKVLNKYAPKTPTAQSNFLNAVNLQPAPGTSPKTVSLLSQVSSKNDPIPNIMYKSSPYKRKLIPPTFTSQSKPKTEQPPSGDSKSFGAGLSQDRMLKEWLQCFLKNFASPQQVASHACFVLLQRVLKYRFFQRLKVTRLVLNMRAKNCEPGKMDLQILLDLRNIFIKHDALTEAGQRFCRFATNDAFGKPVALTTDARTGKVTCRTRLVSSETPPSGAAKISERPASSTQTSQIASNPRISTSIATSSPATPVPSSSTTLGSNSNCSKRTKRLRKLSDGVDAESNDNDYTPYMGELVLEEEVVSERKKSLRTNRTKRKEAGFTYSEDHDDEEFEALAKKIEDKKREELRLAEEKAELEKEREKERKVKKTVAKKTTSKRQSVVAVDTDLPKEPIRKKLRLVDAEILGAADDDLLTPTWVEADGDDDGDVDSLLDFTEAPQTPENHTTEKPEKYATEDGGDTKQSFEDVEPYSSALDVGTNKRLKNTSRNHHTQCKKFDFCVHCLKRVPRIVHHYVNEHRSGEVFTSRLRTRNIRRLLTTSNVGFVHLYKGNQQQYAAHCIFCDKEVKFLLPYWYEHFTMHTGEYSFKCSGCNIRKPTRSLLANHLQSGSGCPKKGTAIRLHTFDTKSNQIEGFICTICNYIQLHRKNVLIHLLTQHEIETVFPDHIVKVVLLQVSGPYRDEKSIKEDEAKLSLLQSSDDEELSMNGGAMDENSLVMQNDFTDNDDLSFMICGMLDVQTNLSDAGNILGNDDETNAVDNK